MQKEKRPWKSLTSAIVGFMAAVTLMVSPQAFSVPWLYISSAVAAVWGGITGTLSTQSDLQTALDAKVAGPASSTDKMIPYWNGTTARLLSDSELKTPNGQDLWLTHTGACLAIGATSCFGFTLAMFGQVADMAFFGGPNASLMFYTGASNEVTIHTGNASRKIYLANINTGNKVLGIEDERVRVMVSESPASNATCKVGAFTWDTSFLYLCTATNTWKRAALTGGY